MKLRNSIVVIFLLFGTLFSLAQTRSTKASKIILVVNNKSNEVEHIKLFASFQKMKQKELTATYDHQKFFLGVLKGTYKLENKMIIPGDNTTIVMYTEKQFFPSEQFFKSDDLIPGDAFNLGKTHAKVIANKKGELTIKTQ